MESLKRPRPSKSDPRSGQAVIEYVLLLSIIVSLYAFIMDYLRSSSLLDNLKKPLTGSYKYTYRYGHPEARGQDDGGPKLIPQQHDGQNFRIFINPPISE
jgi:hypothetical protein